MNYRVLALLCFIVFLAMFGWNIGEKFLAFYSSSFLSPTQISLVIMCVYLVFALSSLFAGTVLEGQGLRKFIAFGILLYAPFLFIVAFFKEFWLYMFGAALVGLGAGFFWLGINTFILRGFEKTGKASGSTHAASILGAVVASLLGGLLFMILPESSYNQPFVLAGFLIIASSITALLLKETSSFARQKASWRRQLELFKNKDLLMLGIISFICSTFTGVILSLVPILIQRLPPILGSLGKGMEVGLVMCVLEIVGIATSFFSGELSDIKGRKPVLYSILLFGSLSAFIIFMSDSVWIVLLGVFLFGPFLFLVSPISVASVGDLMKTERSLSLAVITFMTTLGVAAGALISAIGSLESLRTPFIAVALLFLVSTLLVKRLPIK